jgi:hypothetical protein
MYTLLKDIKKEETKSSKDFDIVCKVLKVFDKDDSSFELRIKDIS